ncbi:hypothetical protein B0O99DRAFT_507196 [Bisporella sp. PMI_857]|nr:hypothetical protein B0O99DRAFT_507196 [Bisporella sp. PMI_857]
MEHHNFEAVTSAFLSWLDTNGVRINPKIALKDLRKEGRGRGVVCISDLEEDEIIFSIPRHAVINLNTTIPFMPDGPLREAITAMPTWLALTTLLILESSYKHNSKWAPYLAVLPHQLDSLVFWSESQLSELQASTVTQKIGKEGAEKMFSQHVLQLGLPSCDIELLHRVASVIMAYAFDIPEEKLSNTTNSNGSAAGDEEGDDLISDDGEDEKTILSMIPLADMLNADGDRNNARLCCDHEELEMRTIKPIKQGEEILNDYGQLPRSDLLRRYGYVTEQYSPYDVAEISTELIRLIICAPGKLALSNDYTLEPLDEAQFRRRIGLAQREGVYEESFDLVHAGPDGPSIPYELLALVYLLLVDNMTLEAISGSESSMPSRSKMSTEIVGQLLVTLFQRRIAEYATSLDDDEILLKTGGLSPRLAAAIQVRLGEKKVLRVAIEEASSYSSSNKRMRGTHHSEAANEIKKRKIIGETKLSKRGRHR